VSLYGISVDEPAASRSFAGDFKINFPLLSDTGGEVAKKYVGLDGDIAVPGIVVIRKGGSIAFRQIARTADDRLTTADVFAAVDRSLGTTGAAAARGYHPLERLQLRVDGGIAGSDGRYSPTGTVAALAPLGRYLVAGPWLRGTRDDLDVDAALGVRVPILGGFVAVQLIGTAGWTVASRGDTGLTAGGRVGAWYAFRPWWSMQLEVGAVAHRLDGDRATEWNATFGIARLFRIRR
jgi:hypothetical protein